MNSGVRVAVAESISALGGATPSAMTAADGIQQLVVNPATMPACGADDLDAVRVREVEMADQRRGGCRFAAHCGAAFAPGDPREGQRLAVVVMQPRDVDLEHPVAMYG